MKKKYKSRKKEKRKRPTRIHKDAKGVERDQKGKKRREKNNKKNHLLTAWEKKKYTYIFFILERYIRKQIRSGITFLCI